LPRVKWSRPNKLIGLWKKKGESDRTCGRVRGDARDSVGGLFNFQF